MFQLILYIFTCIETFLFQLIDETFRYDITLSESESCIEKRRRDRFHRLRLDVKYVSSTERVLIQEEQFRGYTIHIIFNFFAVDRCANLKK